MLIVVFRNRVREGMEQEFGERSQQIYELALKMPGLVSSKDFVAEDGERLALIEFRSAEELEAWRVQSEHYQAQQQGKERYFSEYSLQVCSLVRESRFKASSSA
ncbi:MAG TPA: antibiotic biosynthesis monooxygenase [Polyangiaceae bacterium]|nr:antibiotic biosynthesis monooxygenase [Polyangiaceae bacterium]